MTFICKDCKQMGKLVTCKVFKTADEDDEALDKYDIFDETWPLAEDHLCAPSGFNKMVAQCRKSIMEAIGTKPSQPMPALYNLMRADYTKALKTRYSLPLFSVPDCLFLFSVCCLLPAHMLLFQGQKEAPMLGH